MQEWCDESEICDIHNGEDENEKLPMTYSDQQITHSSMSQKSSSTPKDCICKDYYPPKGPSINNNNYNNNNKKSATNIKATTLETPITATMINASHFPQTSISNSNFKTDVKRSSVAQRHHKTIEQAEKFSEISQKDIEMRNLYYTKKLELYEMELKLKERDVIAKENICTLLKQFITKTTD